MCISCDLRDCNIDCYFYRYLTAKTTLVDCNIIMYRHSLKRSKIEQVELYTKTTPRPHPHHPIAFNIPTQSLPAPIEEAILFPVSFYEQQE